MNPLRRRTFRRWLTYAVIAASVVVVILLILIANGTLVLPSKSPAPVTITYVHLQVLEGNTSAGYPWFGPNSTSVTFTNGFPLQVAPGGTFSVVWLHVTNFDSIPHTLKSVLWSTTPSVNVTKASTIPALPDTIAPDTGESNLEFIFTAPSTPGATYSVNAVLSAGVIS